MTPHNFFTKKLFVIFTPNVLSLDWNDNKNVLVHCRHLSQMAALTKLNLVTKALVIGQPGAYAENVGHRPRALK